MQRSRSPGAPRAISSPRRYVRMLELNNRMWPHPDDADAVLPDRDKAGSKETGKVPLIGSAGRCWWDWHVDDFTAHDGRFCDAYLIQRFEQNGARYRSGFSRGRELVDKSSPAIWQQSDIARN
jgi:hypothetical protein